MAAERSREDALGWLASAKRLVEERLIEGSDEGMAPHLYVRAAGRLEVALMSNDPRALIDLAPVAVSGFEGDELVFATDSYTTGSETNPEGQEWSRGEMQRRAHEPAEAAMLSEAVLVFRAQRSGGFCGVNALYRRTAGRIAWEDDRVIDQAGGPMPDALRKAVQAPPLADLVASLGASINDFGLTEREAALHGRMGAVHAMATRAALQGAVVGFGIPAPEEPWAVDIIERSMRRIGLAVEIWRLNPDGSGWPRRR